MDIHHLVWLVGEQKDWKRWIESFDVFLALSDSPSFFDLEVVMASMLKGVPVIGLKAKGYEELIEESRTGALIDHNNSEVLAQKIVKLYQDKQLRGEIAENARAVILNNYNREKQLDKLKQLILAS
jgi:glycosyltransferase involved in cell wall biosynthesis